MGMTMYKSSTMYVHFCFERARFLWNYVCFDSGLVKGHLCIRLVDDVSNVHASRQRRFDFSR
jgi:hypothetical protein